MFSNYTRHTLSRQSYFRVRHQKLKVPIRQLCKNRKTRAEAIEMEINNLRLIFENQSIIEENEKLRKRARQLQQENKDLLSHFHKANDRFDSNQ